MKYSLKAKIRLCIRTVRFEFELPIINDVEYPKK